MAPLVYTSTLPTEPIRQVSRSISTSLSDIDPGADSPTIPPLGPVLTFISRHTSRVVDYVSQPFSRSPTSIHDALILPKRQSGAILAIPTTYAGLNAGPQPGTVVAIVLGSVAGFLLVLYLFYTAVSFSGYFSSDRVVEEEIIRRRSRSPRRRSPSRSETIEIASERSPPRRERRRTTETIVVEERIRREPSPPPEDDIVEVIEEHSPERPRPSRRESKRASGFRTVDPAEFGGGDRPMRKVSRR